MSVRRDYKPRTAEKKPANRGVRVLGWAVVTLALFGAGAGGWGWWQKHRAAKAEEAAAAAAAAGQAGPAGGKPSLATLKAQDARAVGSSSTAARPGALPELPPSRFSFYHDLQKRQVQIQQDEIGRSGKGPVPEGALNAQTIVATPPAQAPAPAPAPKPAPAASPPPAAAQQTASATPAASGRGYLVQAGVFSTSAQAERVRASLALLGVAARIEAGTTADGAAVSRVRLGPYKDAVQAKAVTDKLGEAGIKAIAIKLD
ncbi:SPOR domain-containing protein [Plasticicumulans sp.]|uniref:SPOR domain-containing protein n=1 Tax=Plasticicumulans sp. TaxID=2307179 RepID=UPI00321FF326